VAPTTILFTPFVEEFFYRGFAFGLLVRRNRPLGYLLPAVGFATQHVLFFWQWMQWVPFFIAVAGLLAFAVIQQYLYEKADSIVAPLVVHAFGDLALMSVAVALFLFQI
jgi:membrane protease YdiL (CAAX protease family)